MPDASADSARPSTLPDASPLHRERLLPSIGVWVVGIAFGSVLGVILVPLSHALSLAVGIIGVVGVCVMLAMASPVIEVSDGTLRAGRARIPADLLGEPEPLDKDGWSVAMSVGFEPLAFHLTRGWVHTGVRVPVLDEADPTPAWVLSTRRPEDLALALRTARSPQA
jgi:hypothetical protein